MIVNPDDLVECGDLSAIIALALLGIFARSSTNQSCFGGKHMKEQSRLRCYTTQGTRPETKRCAIVCIRVLEQTTEFVSFQEEKDLLRPIFAKPSFNIEVV
jgi:hypothetical protein